MNPANFSNVGGGLPGGANPHGQMQSTGKSENTGAQQVLKYIGMNLSGQGPFTGWRAAVTLQERGMKVYQIINSFRLIQPRAELPNIVQTALSFEQNAFREAREKSDYEKECNTKLLALRDTRARQATLQGGGMMQQPGAAAGMPGIRPNPTFSQQINRPMQASPIPQQPMAMGVNGPNQQGPPPPPPQQPQ
ncbi:hypothetical protein Egran_04026, partial [Elaphomyces granulatus]